MAQDAARWTWPVDSAGRDLTRAWALAAASSYGLAAALLLLHTRHALPAALGTLALMLLVVAEAASLAALGKVMLSRRSLNRPSAR